MEIKLLISFFLSEINSWLLFLSKVNSWLFFKWNKLDYFFKLSQLLTIVFK